MDPFAVLADPVRRELLGALLRGGEQDVTSLVAAVRSTQPNVSKHLRVLREHGWVELRADGRRRLHRLTDAPPPLVEEWLAPYRARWQQALDRLGEHLDADLAPASPPRDRPGPRARRKDPS